jgi:hypothetical protein
MRRVRTAALRRREDRRRVRARSAGSPGSRARRRCSAARRSERAREARPRRGRDRAPRRVAGVRRWLGCRDGGNGLRRRRGYRCRFIAGVASVRSTSPSETLSPTFDGDAREFCRPPATALPSSPFRIRVRRADSRGRPYRPPLRERRRSEDRGNPQCSEYGRLSCRSRGCTPSSCHTRVGSGLAGSMPNVAIASVKRLARYETIIGKCLQRRECDPAAIDFEEVAQLAPVVAAAEAVGSERVEATSPRRTAGCRRRTISCSRSRRPRARGAREDARHVGHAPFVRRMQEVPAFGRETVAAEFVETRRAPDVGSDAERLQAVRPRRASTSRKIVPEPISCTRGPGASPASRSRYAPRKMPSSTTVRHRGVRDSFRSSP